MRRLIPLLVCTLLAACDSKSPSSSGGGSSAPQPAGKAVTLESGGAKLEIPEGALARDQKVVFAPATDVKGANASQAFTVRAEQAAFAKPAIVTLPLDKARLPADLAPELIYPVLEQDGVAERLEAMKVDLTGGTMTFALERIVALVHHDGGAAGAPKRDPVVYAAFDPDMKVIASTEHAIFAAPKTITNDAELVEQGKSALKLVRRIYEDVNGPQPGRVMISFVNTTESWSGICPGTHTVGINLAFWTTASSDARIETLAHEYFHLIQHAFVAQNMRKTAGYIAPDQWHRGAAGWFYEATATWMEGHLIRGAAANNLSYIKPDFAYQPLNFHGGTSGDLHQYAAFIFFSWIDTLYAARKVILDSWNLYLSGDFKRIDLATDSGQGRGCFSPIDVLDHVLQATPDNKGRHRTLREVYAEFLLHFGWLKDFPPLDTRAHKAVIGDAGDVVLPERSKPPVDTDAVRSWTFPADDGGTRALKRSLTVAGGPFCIVKALTLRSACDASKNEKGNLTITLDAGAGDPKESMIIVFPFKRGVEDPVVGNSKSPAVIPNWENQIGAIVWIVDMSSYGGLDLTVTAELKPDAPPPTTGNVPPIRLRLDPTRTFQDEGLGDNYSVCFQLVVEPPANEAELRKTDEGQIRLSEIYYEWSKVTDAARENAWQHLEINIDGRTQHLYCLGGEATTVGYWTGDILLPFRPGTYPVTATTKLLGQTFTCTASLTDRGPSGFRDGEGSFERVRKQIETLRQELADAKKTGADDSRIRERLAISLNEIGAEHDWHHRDAEARAAWNEALTLGSTETKKHSHRRLADLCLSTGDLDGYLKEISLAVETPKTWELGKRWLLLKNDAEGARKIFRDGGTREEDLKDYLHGPRPGEKIAK